MTELKQFRTNVLKALKLYRMNPTSENFDLLGFAQSNFYTMRAYLAKRESL